MLHSIQSIMRIAGRMMLDAQNAAIHQKEGHFNFVTDTDVAVQEFLKKELSRLRVVLSRVFYLFSKSEQRQSMLEWMVWNKNIFCAIR